MCERKQKRLIIKLRREKKKGKDSTSASQEKEDHLPQEYMKKAKRVTQNVLELRRRGLFRPRTAPKRWEYPEKRGKGSLRREGAAAQ